MWMAINKFKKQCVETRFQFISLNCSMPYNKCQLTVNVNCYIPTLTFCPSIIQYKKYYIDWMVKMTCCEMTDVARLPKI